MWKNRVGWCVAALGALALYLFENNGGTLILLLTAVLLPLGSALALYLPKLPLEAELALPETARRGEALACALNVRYGGRLPLFQLTWELAIENRLTGQTAGLMLSSAPGAGEGGSLPFTLESAHCGLLAVELRRVRAVDPLGLFARRLPCACGGAVSIPPEASLLAVTLADTADFLQESQSYSTRKPGFDPSETFRVREYQPGDPIRQIHWKLSEKLDKTLIRDLGLPVVDRMLLLLEHTALEQGPLTAADMDGMLALLWSLSQALTAMEVPHVIGWQDHEAYAELDIDGPGALAAAQDRLLSCPIRRGDVTVTGCFAGSHAQCAYAHVAVISPYPPPDVELLCQGNRVTVLLTRPDPHDAGTAAILHPCDPAALAAGELSLEL